MYSAQFSFNTALNKNHMELIKAFRNKESFETKYDDINTIYKDGIEVLTVGSDTLLDTKLEKPSLIVKGPYGIGIPLQKQTEGVIIGIVHGLAIGLFIDLATYILRRNIQRAGKLLKKNYTVFGNENFNRLDNENFKLVLVGLHESEEEAIGHDLCVEADKVAKEFMFGNFEYYEKIGDDCNNLEDVFRDHANLAVSLVVCAVPKRIADIVEKLTLQYEIKQSNVMYL